MSESVFLIAFAMVATTIIITARTIAGAIGGRRASSEVNQLRDQLDQHEAALEDVQQRFADQAAQLAELQERVDFAERMLAQSRDRAGLPPGERKPEPER